METKAFFDYDSPDQAMAAYRRGHDNLYDRVKESVIADALTRLFPGGDLAGKQVLEIGCGGGLFTEAMLGMGARVTGVDMSVPILVKCRELYRGACFVAADATNVCLAKQFDLVFAKDVVEHIERDDLFLANMNRHLRPGGAIVLSTQNSRCLNYLVQGTYHRLRGNTEWRGWDATHLRFYNRPSLARKLSAAGFDPVDWYGSYYLPYRLLSSRLGRWAECRAFCAVESLRLAHRWPFNSTGWNIGVSARKARSVD